MFRYALVASIHSAYVEREREREGLAEVAGITYGGVLLIARMCCISRGWAALIRSPTLHTSTNAASFLLLSRQRRVLRSRPVRHVLFVVLAASVDRDQIARMTSQA